MNKTKRLLALVLALVMSLTLFACGRKAQDDKTDDSTRTEDTTRVFTRAGVEPVYTDDRMNNRSVLAAVAAGLGSTVFSRLELDYYARQDLTVRAMDPPCCRELGVALRPGVKGDAVVRSFLRALRAAADADK